MGVQVHPLYLPAGALASSHINYSLSPRQPFPPLPRHPLPRHPPTRLPTPPPLHFIAVGLLYHVLLFQLLVLILLLHLLFLVVVLLFPLIPLLVVIPSFFLSAINCHRSDEVSLL